MAILAQLTDDVVVHKFNLTPPMATLGRHPGCEIQIDDSSISGNHAKITLEPNKHFPEYLEIFIEDLGSTNGTFINEQPVLGRQRLRNNDIIRLAWNKFKFIDNLEAKLEKTTHMLYE